MFAFTFIIYLFSWQHLSTGCRDQDIWAQDAVIRTHVLQSCVWWCGAACTALRFSAPGWRGTMVRLLGTETFLWHTIILFLLPLFRFLKSSRQYFDQWWLECYCANLFFGISITILEKKIVSKHFLPEKMVRLGLAKFAQFFCFLSNAVNKLFKGFIKWPLNELKMKNRFFYIKIKIKLNRYDITECYKITG